MSFDKRYRYYRLSTRSTWNQSYMAGDIYSRCWDSATRTVVELHTGGDMPYGPDKLKKLAQIRKQMTEAPDEIREHVASYKLPDFMAQAGAYFKSRRLDQDKMVRGSKIRLRGNVRFNDKRKGVVVSAKAGDCGTVFWIRHGERGSFGYRKTGRVGVEFPAGTRIFCSTDKIELDLPDPTEAEKKAWAVIQARKFAGLTGCVHPPRRARQKAARRYCDKKCMEKQEARS